MVKVLNGLASLNAPLQLHFGRDSWPGEQELANTNAIQLSKEEESESTDAEVTREDQDKINTFSKLHNRSKILQEELSQKQVGLRSQVH